MSLSHGLFFLLASRREGALDGGPAEALSPGDLGDWLMMEPGAAAPTDLCPFLLPGRVGLDTGVSRAIWGDCRVEEAEQSWQCGSEGRTVLGE